VKLDGLLKEYRDSLPVAPPMDFEALSKQHGWKSQGWWLAGLAAAAMLAMVWMWPQAAKPPIVRDIAAVMPEAVAETPREALAANAPPIFARRAKSSARRPLEDVEGFVAIGEPGMLPQPAMFQVLRVSVSGPRLAALGVLRADQPVSNTMTADVLLGDDGMARAIRVVANE